MSEPVNPCSGEDAINQNEVILNISGDLTMRNFNSIKFLITDLVTPSTLEDLQNARDVLDHLQQLPDFKTLFAEILNVIGRPDLMSRYGYKLGVKEDLNNRLTVPLISNFRKLLHTVSEKLDSNDLANLKLLCSGDKIPKDALQSISSGYALFLALEKQAVIREDNVEFLKSILTKARLTLLAQTVETYPDVGSPQTGHIHEDEQSYTFPAHVVPDTRDSATGHGKIDDYLNHVMSYEIGGAVEDGTGVTKKQLIEELAQTRKELQKFKLNKFATMQKEYRMTNSPRGHCVIINNMDFRQQSYRRGSEVDCEALKTRFEQLNFNVRIEQDLNKEEVEALVREYREIMDHSCYDCFAVCVLSHGVQDHFFCADEKAFNIQNLMRNFSSKNCPSLAGKPKLFIIQASQICGGYRTGNDLGDTTPHMADMVLAQSTSPGHQTFRSTSQGSWFITALCDVLYQCQSELHFTDMLIEVNRRVTKAKVVRSDTTICQQCPAPVISLRKALWFRSNAAVGQPSD